MIKLGLFILSLSLCAQAVELVSPESLLARPMDSRLKEFRKMGDQAKSMLVGVAFGSDHSLLERWRAITTMGRLDPLAFRPELDRALVSREWFMRNAALIALQTDERARAVAWSMRMLDDKALVVRTQAVRNLIDLDARESEPVLWEKLFEKQNFKGKESLWIRAHIAEALARFGMQGRTKNFKKMLLDKDERLYKWAILGLEKTTGIKLGNNQEPIEIRRQKWLSFGDSGTVL